MTKIIKKLLSTVLLAVIALSSGCLPATKEHTEIDLTTAAYLTLFLNTPQLDYQLDIRLSDIELYAETLWYPLDSSTIHTAKHSALSANTTQQLLAAGAVATGSFSRIRFKLQISDDSGKLLRQEQTELPLPSALELPAGASSALFITSNIAANTLDIPIAQQFTVHAQQRPLADELLYVLCPKIQTLYVARVSPCQVIAAYGVGSGIIDMVIDNSNQLLYLLDSQQHLLQRFDTIAQSFTDRIPLPLADEPQHIGINADGNALYISDAYSQKLLKVNTETGTLVQQQDISYQLGKPYPFTHQNQDYVALLSPREQQLTVLSASSLIVQYTVNAGLQPYDIVYADQQLLVSDTFARQILLINPESGNINARIATTQIPETLYVDDSNNNIIIGSQGNNTLAFLPFGQQLVARSTKVGGAVGDITMATARRLLFAALPQQQQISVIDLPSEKQITTISVAAPPSVIVFQEP
ncbi:MAG: hypothetical protein RBR22_04830 [Desulfuromonas sp.]|nr:hypothetical protein [Desulfuromonas sp.]